MRIDIHPNACLAWSKKIILGLLTLSTGAALETGVLAQDNVALTPLQETKVFAGGGNYTGDYTNIEFKASLSGDFTANPVSVSVSGAPAGVTASFTTTTFTNSQNKDTLHLAVANVAKSTYPITISATTNGVPIGNTFTVILVVGTLWTNATDVVNVDWSSSANWSGGAPTAGDNVMFQNFGTTNYVPGSLAVDSLTFLPNIANVTQNLTLAPGSTLSVLGTNGFAMNIDFPSGNSQRTTGNFAGSGSTFLVSNSVANFAVNGRNSTTGTTLDMRNLDTFVSYVNQFGVGDNELAVQGEKGQQAVKLYFAKTNLVNANHLGNLSLTNHDYLDFAVSFVNNTHDNNNGSSFDAGLLGLAGVFQADSFGFGQGRAGGSSTRIKFNSTAFDSSASFRNADGTSRVSLVAAAVDSYGPGGTGSNTKFQLDFSGGNVDMLVDEMWLGRNGFYTNTSSAIALGKLLFNQGTVDVNTMRLGYQAYTNDSIAQGTVTVGGDAAHSALLVVNTDLDLGYTSGDNVGTGANASQGYGQVTVKTNGVVRANQITVGKLSKSNFITVENGGMLEVSNTIASASTKLATLTVNSGGHLALHRNGANTLVYVTNLVASSGIIDLPTTTGAGSFTPIIAYAPGSGEAASFVGGTYPSGYYGINVFNNTTTHTIDVTLLSAPPKNLMWKGYVDNKWDTATKNWLDLDTGVHTNFSTGDSVVFDDTATQFSIDVTEDVAPLQSGVADGMVMTNNSNAYNFSGVGGIRGAAKFSKYGTQDVQIANYSEILVTVNEGSLTGSGTIGSAVISAGTSCLWSGTVLGSVVTAGSLDNSGSINSGLTVQTGGAVTNQLGGTIKGAWSMQTGTTLGNAGTLIDIGSPTIPTNAVVFNDGSIYGQELFISGTLEDTGVGFIGMGSALTINGGGVFIPGGDSIGTTTINEYPLNTNYANAGRILLGTGSTNVFKVNPGVNNTVVKSDVTSLGPNHLGVAYDGGTIQIINLGGSFSAGQTFPLFQNTYGGPIGNAGNNTTNSYPVVTPAAPGAGLQWDLSTIIQDGVLRIKTINVTPTNIVYSTSIINSGSNIVVHLSWPEDYTGWYLQVQQAALTNGLSTNWTTIGGSSFTNDIVLTNDLQKGSQAVFYRMTFPNP